MEWERQKGESTAAYEAFLLYRNAPYCSPPEKRSLPEVGRKLGKGVGTLERWSAAFDWVERCRLYDNELQREELKERKRGIRAMVKKHIAVAGKMLEKSVRAFEKMPEESMKPRDVLEFIKWAVEIERRARLEGAELQETASPTLEPVESPLEQLTRSLREAYAMRQEESLRRVQNGL